MRPPNAHGCCPSHTTRSVAEKEELARSGARGPKEGTTAAHNARARVCTHAHTPPSHRGAPGKEATGRHTTGTTETTPRSRIHHPDSQLACLLGAAVAAIGTSDTSAIWNDDNHSIRLRCRLPVPARARALRPQTIGIGRSHG